MTADDANCSRAEKKEKEKEKKRSKELKKWKYSSSYSAYNSCFVHCKISRLHIIGIAYQPKNAYSVGGE